MGDAGAEERAAGAAQRPAVVVVGPFFTSTAGGVVTFQRNLMEGSSLKERWRFVPFSTARPVKEKVVNNYSYGAVFNSGIRRAFTGIGITAWHIASFIPALRRHRAVAVQIQSSDFYNFWEGMIYVAQAQAAGVPAVIRFGGDFRHFYEVSSPRTRRLIRRLLAMPDGIIVQSQGWKDYLSTLTDAGRLHVVGNAVPAPPPPPDRSQRTGPVRLLFICTADAKRKGVDAVLELAPRLRGRARLVFVAAGEPVQARVRELGLEDVIELNGSVPPARMAALYREADVLLLPSFSEGFPNSMLEAMAAALPVVASPVGAVPEVITDGVNGYLVPPGDGDALAAATAKLIDDQAHRLAVGLAGLDTVRTHYELDVMFSRFDHIWQQVIDAR